MKKLNAKGFTLIELLAVITIMGILMMVAIPTVSRTIENSRKDTFLDTVNQYVNGVKNMWAADSFKCDGADGTADYLSSAVPEGYYYVKIQTLSSSVPVLLEQGGKSSWGSREMAGYVIIHVDDVEETIGGVTKTNRKVTYYPTLVDGIHGINVQAAGNAVRYVNGSTDATKAKSNVDLVRGDIVMSGAVYKTVTGVDGALAATSDIATPKTVSASGNNAYLCWEV